MTVGDLIGTISSVIGSATLVAQPTGSDEWIIHNFYCSDTIDLKVVGSSTVIVETDLSSNLTAYFFHANNSHFYQMVNKTSNTIYVGYDGIQSK